MVILANLGQSQAISLFLFIFGYIWLSLPNSNNPLKFLAVSGIIGQTRPLLVNFGQSRAISGYLGISIRVQVEAGENKLLAQLGSTGTLRGAGIQKKAIALPAWLSFSNSYYKTSSSSTT